MQCPYIPRGCKNEFRAVNKAFRPLQRIVEAQCVRRLQLVSPVATVFESERERRGLLCLHIYVGCKARKSKFNEGIDAIEELDSDTVV